MDKLEANGVQMAVTGADKLFPTAPAVEAAFLSRVHLRLVDQFWNLVDKTGLIATTIAGTHPLATDWADHARK